MLQPPVLFLPGIFFSGLRGCSEIVWILPEFFWMTFAKIPGLSPICRKLPLRTLLPLVDPLERLLVDPLERGTSSKVKFHFEARVGKKHKKLASNKKIRSKICVYFIWVANCQCVGHLCPKEHLKTSKFSNFPSIWSNEGGFRLLERNIFATLTLMKQFWE